ncbi:hypothetical protein [Pseudoduganella sp. OTU4001]|uniref:hypothetical protein n=1 Tax=Pseudoduganella sp. OTU4001 TaxID=3043854 RepID=UPI00313D5FBE
MDDRERIAKVETEVTGMQKDIDRLYGAIESLREHMDRGFAEQRKELAVMTRWMVGLTIMLAGMFGRLFGLY